MSTEPVRAVTTLPVQTRVVAQTVDIFSDPGAFEHAQRVAKVFASSKLVPQHLQGNVADCLIALQIARRLNEEPLTVMQNIYIVSGRPGWFTAYMIARANRSGTFKGSITWKSEGQGDGLAVTATAVLAETGEAVSVTCDMRMAKAEGWTKNAKYTSMPEHMLRWRSAAMLIRLYCPEVMLGMPVLEEIETEPRAEMRDVTPARSINEALDAFAGESETADTTDTEASPQQRPPSPAAGPAAPETVQLAPGSAQTGAADGPAWPEGRVPTTEGEYAEYTRNGWFQKVRAGQIKAADAQLQWKSDKTIRNKIVVGEELRDILKAELDAIIAGLPKAEG